VGDGPDPLIEKIAQASSFNKRVTLIRGVPEAFGKAQHQSIYAAIAEAVYVGDLAPDFGYVHWRDEYELPAIEGAYAEAIMATDGFTKVSVAHLEAAIASYPAALRIFRLLLGLTAQEFAATTSIVAEKEKKVALSVSSVKSLEAGKFPKKGAASIAALTIDAVLNGHLFPGVEGDVRSKITKPDTLNGWDTVRKFATEGVPLPTFLHQRHYGGAFRQLLDATSGKRGDLLEGFVSAVFDEHKIKFVQTGAHNQKAIEEQFGLTVKPAPDFLVYDNSGTLRAILECKHANDGGTARDKAARFSALRSEASRLGGVPVFAVLAGLGWRRTADTLGPVVRDTDGRVFTAKTLSTILTVDPFPSLLNDA